MENSEKKGKEASVYCMFQGPGPAYRLKTCIGMKDHCPTVKQGPAFSIGHRPKDKSEAKPGSIYWYDPRLTSHGKAHIPTVYLAGRPKDKPINDVTPGPGEYNLMNLKSGILSKDHRPPKISMGGRPRWTDKSDAPPPNRYEIATGLGSRSQTAPLAPSWSIGGRTDFGSSHYGALKEATPGPANYSTVRQGAYLPAQGGFTIRGRTTDKDYRTVKDNPGPNAYDPQNSYQLMSKRRGFTMGIRHSKFIMPLIDSTVV